MPEVLTVVGGESRNALWNRIRADVTGLPIRLTNQTENTALGAAVFSFIGEDVYHTIDEAMSDIKFFKEAIEPSYGENGYENLYNKYQSLNKLLS
jgi:sugar (pentulose or hexulose) kinase